VAGFVLTWRSAPIAGLLAVVLFATGAAAADAAAGEPLRQSPGYGSPPDLDVWRQQEQRDGLRPYPPVSPGMPNPAGGLFQFGGGGRKSFSGPDLGMPFAEWMAQMTQQRTAVDRGARAALEARFRLDCLTDPSATMSRGKPLAVGPTARLPAGVGSWEAYAALSPEQIHSGGAFPWTPLDHPLQSTMPATS
jgi:hypothetical protein